MTTRWSGDSSSRSPSNALGTDVHGAEITTSGPSPRASQWSSTPSGSGSFGTVRNLSDRVARTDRAAAQDVRPQAAAMYETAQGARRREALEVVARLAQLDAHALDVADHEALAHQRVEPDAARVDLTAALARSELDALLGRQRLECLGLDQREVAPGLLIRRRVLAIVAGAPPT